MSDSAGLERGYRRLLTCYPRTFRHENEQEILGVLMAGARDGQRRPGLAESADLVRGGLWLRLRPGPARPPRTVLGAVRLLYAAAAVEVAGLIIVLMTAGAVRSAIVQRHPNFTAAQLRFAFDVLTVKEVWVAVAVGLWLLLAWAAGRGHDWVRPAIMAFFALISLGLLATVGLGVTDAAGIAVGAVLWLIALATLVLIFNPRSGPYFRPEPAQHEPARQ
jgi:hypothetical protein